MKSPSNEPLVSTGGAGGSIDPAAGSAGGATGSTGSSRGFEPPSSMSPQPTARAHWRDVTAKADLKGKARRTAWISALIGLAILGICVLIAASWRADLPSQIAAHWGIDGQVTRYTSFWGHIWPLTLAGVLTILMFVGIGGALGSQALIRKWIAGMNVWTGTFMGLIILSTLWIQRGHDGVAPVGLGSGNSALILPIVGSAIALIVTAASVPGDPPLPTASPVTPDAVRTSLPDDKLATWHRIISGRNAIIVGLAACALLFGMAYLLRDWATFITGVLILPLLLAMTAFSVRVDNHGLTVRSVVGWPRTHIPLNEVVRASATQVSPFGDFGGWGWRAGLGGDRSGVVLRTGSALKVDRTGGRTFFVTTDDAESAAALLNTLADRSRFSGTD